MKGMDQLLEMRERDCLESNSKFKPKAKIFTVVDLQKGLGELRCD
jgi:hypothetical protein